jgi:4,4'-diaponeurosporenoate glycosyltransferase
VVEDAALAVAYHAAGRPVRVLAGGRVVRFRMYPEGLRSLVQGWTKNLAGGALRAPVLPTLGAVVWVAAALSVTLGVALDPSPATAAAYVAFAGQLIWMLRRLGSFSPLAALVFPVPLLAFVLLFLRSAALRIARRPVTWRGRCIPARP